METVIKQKHPRKRVQTFPLVKVNSCLAKDQKSCQGVSGISNSTEAWQRYFICPCLTLQPLHILTVIQCIPGNALTHCKQGFLHISTYLNPFTTNDFVLPQTVSCVKSKHCEEGIKVGTILLLRHTLNAKHCIHYVFFFMVFLPSRQPLLQKEKGVFNSPISLQILERNLGFNA